MIPVEKIRAYLTELEDKKEVAVPKQEGDIEMLNILMGYAIHTGRGEQWDIRDNKDSTTFFFRKG